MTDGPGPPALPTALPRALLGPLLTWAGELLHELKGEEVPPSLRPLLGFDRRGFASEAARAQLQRALEADDGFRARAYEAFAERDDVVAVLGSWDPSAAVARVRAAAKRDDLPLLTSALVAARPEEWESGAGMAAAVYEEGLARRASDDDRRAYETQLEKAEEGRRRAEDQVRELETEVARLVAELRSERASRRAREESAQAETEALAARVGELEEELRRREDEAQRAEARLGREAERVAKAEAAVREAQAEVARALERAERAEGAERVPGEPGPSTLVHVSPEDLEALTRAAEVAARLAAILTDSAPSTPGGREPKPAQAEAEPDAEPERVADEPAAEPGRGSRRSRSRVPVPAGMIGTSAEGLGGALRTGEPVVIVDGYNVTMEAWPEAEADAQRQRLCALLERLHLRTRVPVTVVFDGADVQGVRPPRRPGVRVVFSAPGEEADDVVVREVGGWSLDRPVVVVSSDRRVQEESEGEGALAVPSSVFLEVLRR